MSDLEKIIEESVKAIRVSYETLSGLDPLDRHHVFVERLHGMHLALISTSLILDEKNEAHAGQKIAEIIRELTEQSCETAKKMIPEAELNEN